MVCDNDGKNFPWYGDKEAIEEVEGPTFRARTLKVNMNDHFFPQVGLLTPLRGRAPLLGGEALVLRAVAGVLQAEVEQRVQQPHPHHHSQHFTCLHP